MHLRCIIGIHPHSNFAAFNWLDVIDIKLPYKQEMKQSHQQTKPPRISYTLFFTIDNETFLYKNSFKFTIHKICNFFVTGGKWNAVQTDDETFISTIIDLLHIILVLNSLTIICKTLTCCIINILDKYINIIITHLGLPVVYTGLIVHDITEVNII